MSTGTTRWLLLLAAAMLAFIVFVERRSKDTTDRLAETAHLLPGLVPGAVEALDVNRGTNLAFSLERVAGQWRFTAPIPYPARAEGIDRLLSQLAAARVLARISAAEVLAQTNGLAAFGLDQPSATVNFLQGETRTTLRFGKRTVIGGQLYAQVVPIEGLFVVDGRLLEALPATLHEWRDRTLVNLDPRSVNRIEVRPPGTFFFEVVREGTNRAWSMTKPLSAPADGQRLEFLLHQLGMLQAVRFVADPPGLALETYGLQPPQAELVLARGTNEVFTLQIGREAPEDPSLRYVRPLTYSNVVVVSRNLLAPWLAGFREFCDRRLMVFDQELVTRIEAVADERFALQRLTNGTWRIVEPYSAPADAGLVREMLGHLADLEFHQFAREVATDFVAYGLDPPRRQYVLKGEGTDAAGATNRTLAQVDYGAPTNHWFFARRGREAAVVLAVEPARVARAAFQLRDRHVWNVSTNQLAGITVQQRGSKRTLVRLGPMQWTVAEGAAEPLNPFRLEEAAFRLGQLTAERWVARGNAQLSRYGITEADHQVSLELRSSAPGEQFVVRFGKPAPAGGHYAAVQLAGEPEPVVFECPSSIYDLVASDLTIPAPGGG